MQISTSDGASWEDLYTQSGTNGSGEQTYATRTVALDAYAGRSFRLRFVDSVADGSTCYPQSDSGVGWNIDVITLTNASTATPGTTSAIISGNTFTYASSPSQGTGLQARTIMAGAYPNEWGSLNLLQTTASTSLGSSTHSSPTTAESYTISVTSNTTWAASSNQVWATVFPTSGIGNGSVTVSVTANTSASSRSATITIGGQTHTLTQAAAATNTSLSSNSHSSPATAESYAIAVSSNTTWTAVSNQTWVTVAPSSGAGNGTVTVTVAANTSASSRSATLTIGGQPHTLSQAASDPGRLTALALLGNCGTGAQELVAGYIISGAGSKSIVIRGVGPALIKQGVTSGTLVDPVLKVTNILTGALLGQNDNWSGNDGSSYGPAPLDAGSKDSVLFLTQGAGLSSARISGASNGTGTAMIEVYDTEPARSDIRFTALSVSAQLDAGQILTPGLIIGGSTPRNLIIRALGPALAQVGITGWLPDPKITLYSLSGGVATVIATNDNWSGEDGRAISLQPYPSSGSKDAIIVTSLNPGNYSLQVSGTGATGGIVMVEIYEMP